MKTIIYFISYILSPLTYVSISTIIFYIGTQNIWFSLAIGASLYMIMHALILARMAVKLEDQIEEFLSKLNNKDSDHE